MIIPFGPLTSTVVMLRDEADNGAGRGIRVTRNRYVPGGTPNIVKFPEASVTELAARADSCGKVVDAQRKQPDAHISNGSVPAR